MNQIDECQHRAVELRRFFYVGEMPRPFDDLEPGVWNGAVHALGFLHRRAPVLLWEFRELSPKGGPRAEAVTRFQTRRKDRLEDLAPFTPSVSWFAITVRGFKHRNKQVEAKLKSYKKPEADFFVEHLRFEEP